MTSDIDPIEALIAVGIVTREQAGLAMAMPAMTRTGRLIAAGCDPKELLPSLAQFVGMSVVSSSVLQSAPPMTLPEGVAGSLRAIVACPIGRDAAGVLEVAVADPDAREPLAQLGLGEHRALLAEEREVYAAIMRVLFAHPEQPSAFSLAPPRSATPPPAPPPPRAPTPQPARAPAPAPVPVPVKSALPLVAPLENDPFAKLELGPAPAAVRAPPAVERARSSATRDISFDDAPAAPAAPAAPRASAEGAAIQIVPLSKSAPLPVNVSGSASDAPPPLTLDLDAVRVDGPRSDKLTSDHRFDPNPKPRDAKPRAGERPPPPSIDRTPEPIAPSAQRPPPAERSASRAAAPPPPPPKRSMALPIGAAVAIVVVGAIGWFVVKPRLQQSGAEGVDAGAGGASGVDPILEKQRAQLDDGNAKLGRNDWAWAIISFTTAIDLRPDNEPGLEARVGRGLAQVELGQHIAARTDFEYVIAHAAPTNAQRARAQQALDKMLPPPLAVDAGVGGDVGGTDAPKPKPDDDLPAKGSSPMQVDQDREKLKLDLDQ